MKGLKFGNRQNGIDAAVIGAEVRHYNSGNIGDINNDKENLSSEDEHKDDINGKFRG